MKLIKEIVYQEHYVPRKINDMCLWLTELEKELEESKDFSFNYFFEMYETNDVVVLANLYSLRGFVDDHDFVIQIETASIDKSKNTLTYHTDNNGFDARKTLENKIVWTKDELASIGIEHAGDAGPDYPFRNVYWHD